VKGGLGMAGIRDGKVVLMMDALAGVMVMRGGGGTFAGMGGEVLRGVAGMRCVEGSVGVGSWWEDLRSIWRCSSDVI
jgi:hypothetical protein